MCGKKVLKARILTRSQRLMQTEAQRSLVMYCVRFSFPSFLLILHFCQFCLCTHIHIWYSCMYSYQDLVHNNSPLFRSYLIPSEPWKCYSWIHDYQSMMIEKKIIYIEISFLKNLSLIEKVQLEWINRCNNKSQYFLEGKAYQGEWKMIPTWNKLIENNSVLSTSNYF